MSRKFFALNVIVAPVQIVLPFFLFFYFFLYTYIFIYFPYIYFYLILQSTEYT